MLHTEDCVIVENNSSTWFGKNNVLQFERKSVLKNTIDMTDKQNECCKTQNTLKQSWRER